MRPPEIETDDVAAGSRYRPWAHRLALLATAFTLPLLYVGGSVTSYGVGMAVPDWPTTFGINMFLYNFWNDPFGVQLEHAHRLYGAAVGLATLALAAWLLAFERRRAVKALGCVALLAVILQGVMGGLRVNQISTTFAALHGSFGQAFYGLMVALVVLTGRVWVEAGPARPDPARFRGGSLLLLGLIYGQVALGAWFRHFRRLDALAAHAALAVVVLGLSHALAARARRHRAAARELLPSARWLSALATLQFLLGLLALWLMLPLGGNPRTPTLWGAMARTVHQTNGALLVAAAVVLVLRSRRHLISSIAPSKATNPDGVPEATPLEALA